jgi:hypothetical protein
LVTDATVVSSRLFVVSEADAAAIRTAYEQEGELSAAIELRRRFPGITDEAEARECVRTIASWKTAASTAAPGDAAASPQGQLVRLPSAVGVSAG